MFGVSGDNYGEEIELFDDNTDACVIEYFIIEPGLLPNSDDVYLQENMKRGRSKVGVGVRAGENFH